MGPNATGIQAMGFAYRHLKIQTRTAVATGAAFYVQYQYGRQRDRLGCPLCTMYR